MAASANLVPVPVPDFSKYVENLEQLINNTSSSSNAAVPRTDTVSSLKLLLVSQHIANTTSCGKISHGLIRELSKHSWISTIHFATKRSDTRAIDRNYPPNIKVIDVFDSDKKADHSSGLGISELTRVIKKETPNIVLIYGDMVSITKYIECIRQTSIERPFRIWLYLDQDNTFIPPPAVDIINRDTDQVFVYSNEWRTHLKGCGVIRNIGVLTPGFDQDSLRIIPRGVARQQANLPGDMFIFLCTYRNRPNKRLDIAIMAFVELIVKYPVKQIFMLCACDKGEQGGYQLFEIFYNELRKRKESQEYFGNRLLVTATSTPYNYKDTDINIFYNLADVGINCSDGVGFGLSAFEQMSVEIPQIVTDSIGYRDFCNSSNSILVKPFMQSYIPTVSNPLGGEIEVVRPQDVSKAMEQYVIQEDLRKVHSANAKETVRKYMWKENILPLLKGLENFKNSS